MPGDAILWHVPPSTRLLWRSWEDEFVVYDTASGQTHCLNLLAAKALRSLEARPANLETLIGALEEDGRSTGTGPPSLRDQLRDLIAVLDEAGLIARIAAP